jgi:hypothetical protein
MSPGFSMMGSGIYSEDVDREIVCAERCESCSDEGKTCDAVWEETLSTDDWGNIDNDVECAKCKHTINYKEERHYD